MPRTESSSVVSQDYLGFYYLFSAITFLGSGLGPQHKNGPGPQISGPHTYQLKKKTILNKNNKHQNLETQSMIDECATSHIHNVSII